MATRKDPVTLPPNRERPPPQFANDDPSNEPPTKALVFEFNGNAPPSQAVYDLVDEARFAFVIQASEVVLQHAQQTINAAEDRDRRAAKLHACVASRACRSLLETVAELCGERVRA